MASTGRTAPVNPEGLTAEDYGRTPDEERMVRFGYYANVAANMIEHLSDDPAGLLSLLKTHGYDVILVLREISEWAYGEGRDAATHGTSPSEGATGG